MPKSDFQAKFNGLLTEIAAEVSEFIQNDPNDENAGIRMGSKSESLCRKLWQMALGYTTTTTLKGGEEKKTIHHPDKWAMREIMDRVDGRTVAGTPSESDAAPMSDQIRDVAKAMANKARQKKETDASDPS